jgi:Na+/H+-dicarboxylate symporter
LRLQPEIVSAIIPLAVATFRLGNVVAGVSTGLIGAALFGIHPSLVQIVAAVGIGVLTNIGSVGVPGAAVVFAAWGPIYLTLGVPLEALTLYIAVITVPDIFITTTNVTGDLAATSLIATLLRKRAQPALEAV